MSGTRAVSTAMYLLLVLLADHEPCHPVTRARVIERLAAPWCPTADDLDGESRRLVERGLAREESDGLRLTPSGRTAASSWLYDEADLGAEPIRPRACTSFPTPSGRLPVHRTDTGALLLAVAYGAARVVYVRDADALAGLPDEVSAKELLARGGALPIDRLALDRLRLAHHVRAVTLVDGTSRGGLTSALDGTGGVTVTAD